MCVDKTGTTHCILVLGDDYDEGILVNSEGSFYARYSALLPNARSFIEQQMGQETKLTLWQLMSCGLEDVHLVDVDEEHDLATIVELNQGTLSVAGRSAWETVCFTTAPCFTPGPAKTSGTRAISSYTEAPL